MTPTEAQRNRVRRNVGASGANLPADIIDDYYELAEAKYSVGTEATEAYVRVLAIDDLLAQAVKDVDYDQNDASEKLSQQYTQLEKLRKLWAGKLSTEIGLASTSSGVRWGAMAGGRPRRVREWPDA